MPIKTCTIRIDSGTLDKLHYVASYEGRSANGEINYLIRKEIEKFEKINGEIQIDKSSKKS